jgi:hypothetical protein
MINRNPRNQSLLRQISEANPFKTLAPAFFDISGGFTKEMEAVRAKQDLSVKGKRNKARDHLREALRIRRDRKKPIAEFHAKTEAMRAQVRLPDYDKTDNYAARLRAEMRDKSYDMTAGERMALMSGPNRIAYFDAISEQPLFMSGLREKGELDVYAATKEERLRELCGPLQDAIAARDGSEREILMVDDMLRNDLLSDSLDSGLSREDFEAEAKAFESKVAAPTPEAPKTEDRKPTTLEQRGPEFEAIWERFDRMVDASVA